MSYSTLISPAELLPHVTDPDWVIMDCRADLTNRAAGRQIYEQGHLPGALYAHLERDLSGPIIAGQTGRHPLPDMNTFIATLSNWGIDSHIQVVVYDDKGGAFAARLWWMLQLLGHEAVAVLDGGWPRWVRQGHPTTIDETPRAPRNFISPRLRPELLVTLDDVRNYYMQRPDYRLFDSRSADRYRGENETLDPVAGHIPGAISAPFADNLMPNGEFRPIEQLHARFTALFADVPVEQTIFYCGSGVTAAHNVLAVAHAGLGLPRLYAGSWSEWITQPNCPIATGV
jgi:thiosulfate/3-mercaptopyruvate sulfurtransferase